MDTAFSAVPVAFQQAAKSAQTLVKDVRNDLGHAAWRTRRLATESRRRISRTAARVERYADDNTALLSVAVLGVGIALGYLSGRKR